MQSFDGRVYIFVPPSILSVCKTPDLSFLAWENLFRNILKTIVEIAPPFRYPNKGVPGIFFDQCHIVCESIWIRLFERTKNIRVYDIFNFFSDAKFSTKT